MFGTIRRRLVLLVLLITVPLVTAMSLVVYRFAHSQLAAQRSGILASTHALAATVDAEVNKHIAVAHSMATSRWLDDGDLPEFYARAKRSMEFLPSSWMLLVDPEGRVLLSTARAYGEVLPPLSEREAHDKAKKSGESEVSNIFVSPLAKRPIASVNMPVIRDGKMIYNIIVTLDPQNFLRILLEQQMPAGWLSGIIDRTGRFIARSRNHAQHVGTLASEGWREAAQRARSGQFENVSVEGEPLFSAYTNSRLTGWSISIAASQASVMAPLQRSLLIMILSALTLIAVSTALAWWAARRIAGPMQALEQAAGALVRNEPAAVGRTGLREIDQALAAFEGASKALAERDERYRSLFEHAADAILIADRGGRCIDANPATGRLLGMTPTQLAGRPIDELVDPREKERLAATRCRAFSGETLVEEWNLRHANGGFVPVEVSTTLLPDNRWYLFVRDLTQRKLAEAAQKQSETQFHALADLIPQLAWMTTADGWIFWYNQRWYEYTGTTLEEMQGWGWQKVHHPDHVERVVTRIKHCFETGEPWEDTFPLRGKDGQYRWFLSRALPIRDQSGQVVRWFGTNTDVSEQKQTEERQRLLVNELNHRVKNTLAVIQSIASVTSRTASTAAAFSQGFISRLLGIARTHDLLTASHWEGAALRDVIRNELEPYQSEGVQRVVLQGDDLTLLPKQAVSLGMVMHEMATNAAKYGALSTADGRLSVTWRLRAGGEDRRLEIVWSESGGPAVSVPTRRGFGSRLVTQSLKHDLGGTVEMDYRREGLRCVMDLPHPDGEPAARAA